MYILLTRDRDGGYRLALSDGPNRTQALMQSRKESQPHGAKRTAKVLFGDLVWQQPADLGITLDYVVEAARVVVLPLEEGE